MSVIDHFHSFLFVFFIIGVAPLYSEGVHEKVKTQTYFLPPTISAILIVSVAGVLVYCNHLADFGQINTIVNCCSLFSAMTFCLSSIFQRCYFWSTYQNIVFQIIKIQSSLEKKFFEKLPVAAFANGYKRKVLFLCLFLTVSTSSATIALWNLIKADGVLIVFLQCLMSGFSGLVVAHSFLFIGIVEMCFRVLNLQIQNATKLPYYKKIEFLKYVKLMHMDLWKVVTHINDFFSWSLLFFNLNYMIYMVYDLYFLFHMLQDEWNSVGISACFFALLYDATCLILLVNSCHFCSTQASDLIENIEEYAFWTNDDVPLYQLKHDILSQISNFPVSFGANGFFVINREHLGEVAATCCTYMIICIDLFLSVE